MGITLDKELLYKIFRILTGIFLAGFISFLIINKNPPSQDIVALIFLLVAVTFRKGKKFFKDWFLIFVFFYCYEIIRGHAKYVHDFFDIEVYKTTLLLWEQKIFGPEIPTLKLQPLTYGNSTFLDAFSFIMYSSFFWGAFLAGFIIWYKFPQYFKKFRNAYLFLCYAGLITYLFFPAYPPWLAAEEGYLPDINRNVWEKLALGKWLTGMFHTVGYNPVAPMPSLHAGWAYLTAAMMDYFFRSKLGWYSRLFYLYPILMGLVIIYTGDHYYVDILAGFIYAHIAVQFGINSERIGEFFRRKWGVIASKARQSR